jgi:hypothetical protein
MNGYFSLIEINNKIYINIVHFKIPRSRLLSLSPRDLRLRKKGEDSGETHHIVLPTKIWSPVPSSSFLDKKSWSSASLQEAAEWCCSFLFLTDAWCCCCQGISEWCHSPIPTPAQGAPPIAQPQPEHILRIGVRSELTTVLTGESSRSGTPK